MPTTLQKLEKLPEAVVKESARATVLGSRYPFKALQQRTKLSVEAIANQLGVSVHTAYGWGQNKFWPTMDPLGMQQLANLYKVDLAILALACEHNKAEVEKALEERRAERKEKAKKKAKGKA